MFARSTLDVTETVTASHATHIPVDWSKIETLHATEQEGRPTKPHDSSEASPVSPRTSRLSLKSALQPTSGASQRRKAAVLISQCVGPRAQLSRLIEYGPRSTPRGLRRSASAV